MPWIAVGALNALLAVAAGAFGAHGLKDQLPAERLAIFHTAAQYHMVHALALVLIGLLLRRENMRWAGAAGWCILAGVVIFCGSLYALALAGQKWLGAITPLGGLSFLVGWALLAVAGLQTRRPAP